MAPAVVWGFDFRPTSPPATRTLPVPSSVAVLSDWHSWVDMHTCKPVLAFDHWPVAGWYRISTQSAITPRLRSPSSVHSQHPPQVFAGWLTKAGVSSSIPARLSQLTHASPPPPRR